MWPPPVEILATDINQPCIVKARSGLYSQKIKGNVSPERLRRFFVKEGDGYRINEFIRQMCMFGEQDVISDAPFLDMDLVSCRNLLIYLDTPTQREVLHHLYDALKPAGFLLLGQAESVMAAPELFKQVQRPQRIYSKLQTPEPMHFAPVDGRRFAQRVTQSE